MFEARSRLTALEKHHVTAILKRARRGYGEVSGSQTSDIHGSQREEEETRSEDGVCDNTCPLIVALAALLRMLRDTDTGI